MASILLKTYLLAQALQKQRKLKSAKRVAHKGKKDDKTVNLKKRRCQVCCKYRSSIPIFSNADRPNLATEIEEVSGVHVYEDNPESKYICTHCVTLLDNALKFRELCKKNVLPPIIKADPVYYENDYCNVESTIDDDIELDGFESFEEALSESESLPRYEEQQHKSYCSKCKNEFDTWEEYHVHLPCRLTLHTREKPKTKGPHLCQTCGKVLKTVASFESHMKSHGNEYPYQCDSCPYKGKHRSLLIIHLRSHLPDSEKPHKCKICGKTTTTAANLAVHMRNQHTTPTPFKCTSCEKVLKSERCFKTHFESMHLQQHNVECKVCGQVFNKKYISRHNRRVHNIRSEKPRNNALAAPKKAPAYFPYEEPKIPPPDLNYDPMLRHQQNFFRNQQFNML